MTKKNSSASIHQQVLIPESLSGKRLDQALSILWPEFSRTRLKNLIEEQDIIVDGHSLKAKDKVKTGQLVILATELLPETSWEGQSIPLTILFEDEQLLVINKPAGLVVHPGAGNADQTLVNALLHYLPELSLIPRAGLIHRLDKDTTGLLIVAKTLAAHVQLTKALSERKIHREYRALIEGQLISGTTYEDPIGRHPKLRTHMAVIDSGKPAVTHCRVLERFKHFTYVSAQLETGRTHQIRVHFSYHQHPLVGDLTYGRRLYIPKQASSRLLETLQGFKRQALHACRLSFMHPFTQQLHTVEAPLPADMQNLLEVIRQEDQ